MIIVTLHKMGFHDEAIERAIQFGGAKTIEDCLPFLVLNENNLMDHLFVSPKVYQVTARYDAFRKS